MTTTIRDIAGRLGVSHATVSRFLNGRGEGFISAPTRDRVRQAAKEMGYRPNAAARALVTGRTGAVAVRIHTIESRLTAPVFASDPSNPWEQHKVTSCRVVPRDGWFDMFYVGFRDIDHAAIGIAHLVTKDGEDLGF